MSKYSITKIKRFEEQRTTINVNPTEVFDIIKSGHNGEFQKYSCYEVLTKAIRKMYFDIENIPKESTEMINDIIRDLKVFYEYKITTKSKEFKKPDKIPTKSKIKHVLTTNLASPHDGLSYHLIFYNYSCNYLTLKDSIKEFLHYYPEYSKFIDLAVYSKDRLFKIPYSYGIKKGESIQLNTDNYHRFVYTDSNGTALTNLVLKRFMIQDVNGTITANITPDKNIVDAYVKIKYVKISAGDADGVTTDKIEKLKSDIKQVYEYLNAPENKGYNTKWLNIIKEYYKLVNEIEKANYELIRQIVDKMMKKLNITSQSKQKIPGTDL